MSFYAVVCGGDRSWPVPTVDNDFISTFGEIIEQGPDGALPADATHLLIICREEWAPQMRRLATLLRAHDAGRHVSVLVTDTTPLGAAVVAEHVNSLREEPGTAARELRRLLGQVRGVVWVRRPGKVNGARPGMWELVRSIWARNGSLAEGNGPVRLVRAEVEQWASLFKDAGSIHRSGEVAPRPEALMQPYVTGEKTWGRTLSPGARAMVGKQPAFEVAVFSPTPVERIPDLTTCSGCGSTVVDMCPFCHAQWGAHHPTTSAAQPTTQMTVSTLEDTDVTPPASRAGLR